MDFEEIFELPNHAFGQRNIASRDKFIGFVANFNIFFANFIGQFVAN
jgi:hypothetical protein